MSKKTRNFSVYARVCGVFSTTISAASLEEAAEKAKAVDIGDVISWNGNDYIDGKFDVIGIQESDWNI